MAFLNKFQVEQYAAKAGFSTDGLTWPMKQKAIADHMKANDIVDAIAWLNGEEQPKPGEPRPKQMSEKKKAEMEEIAELKRKLAQAKAEAKAIPQVPVVFEMGKAEVTPTIEDYENAVLIASPEQRPTAFQPKKYYNTVGTQKDTQEISLDIGKDSPFHGDESGVRNATYTIEDTGRPVEAECTMPKYSCLLIYRPTKNLCAMAEYGGHRGYLWTHQRLPNVRGMLEQMGAYEEFKDEWQKQPGRMFYLGGLLCCDISFTESMFDRIIRELKKRDKDEL